MDTTGSKNIIRDIMWYLLGSAIPMTIAFIRSPIYTRIFSPEDYGYYTLAFITFNYLSLVFFSWLSGCVWRYYNQFKKEKKLNTLITGIVQLFVLSSIILGLLTIIWYGMIHNELFHKLVLLSFFYYLTNELIVLLFINVKLEGKAKLYNLLISFKSSLAFLLLLLMTFKLNYGIEAFLSSTIIMNGLLIIGYIIWLGKKSFLNFFQIDIPVLKLLINYGGVGIILNLSLLILVNSDRYFIQWFDKIEHVGIYNQIYNLGQISVSALINVFMAAINPSLLHEYENNLEGSNSITNYYIRIFIYMFLPLTIYFSLFSKQLSTVLLGEKFRVGYPMIPYIMVSSFLYGLVLFNEIKLKFANSFRRIIILFLVSGLINIVLNLLLIPEFGYQVAAVTTLIAYFILFTGFYFSDSNQYFKDHGIQQLLLRILPVVLLQCLLDVILRKIIHLDINVILSVLEALLFLIIYILYTRKLRISLFKQ